MPLLHLVVQQQLEHSVLPHLLLWECCHHPGETDTHSEIQVNTRKKIMVLFQYFSKSYFRAVVIAKVKSCFWGCCCFLDALTTTVVEKTIPLH